MQLYIFGAKALALGMYRALSELYPEFPIQGFLVSPLKDNAPTLAGLPVMDLLSIRDKNIHILIATPEDLHPEITDLLEQNGFHHYTCMNSRREAKLMEQYFIRKGDFVSLHTLPAGTSRVPIEVFMAKFYKDKALENTYELPDWTKPLQVGAALTRERVAKDTAFEGDNISAKNVNYCELTALYWLWKNRLQKEGAGGYYGLFHYRRILDLCDADVLRLEENGIDAVLSYPTLHEPDILEHHARYIKDADWEAMLRALRELQPEYYNALKHIGLQPYFYNYNMLIAKHEVLKDYCEWLFPILERTEELSEPRGWERKDRYIGYLGESLMTLYFLYHKADLRIAHTGRLMLT